MNALFPSELVPDRPEPVAAAAPVSVADEPRETIDLHRLAALLRRNAALIAVVLVLALGAGLLATLLTTPRYIATTRIQVEQQAERVLRTEDDAPAAAQDAERFLQTATDVLKSRSIAIGVAQSLRLFGDARFHRAMGAGPPATGAAERETVIGLIEGGLAVDLPRNSRIVSLSFQSRDPQTAADVANAVARTFIAASLQRKFAASAYSRDFLAGQLVEAKARLERSERELNGYARGAGLLATRPPLGVGGAAGGEAPTTPQSVTTASLTQLNTAFNAAKAARIAAEQRWREAASRPAMTLPDVLASPAVQTLMQQRATLTAELREARERYRSGFPALQEKASQLDEVDQQLAAIAGDVRQSLFGRYEAAAREETALGGEVARLRAASLTEQDNSVRFTILAREVDTNRALYDALLGRFKELSATAGVTASNVSIIDQAEPPLGPSSPRPLFNAAVALLAGAVVAAALVLLRERIDDVARGPLDLERKLRLPALGVVPRMPADAAPIEQLRAPKSAAAEAYAALRSALLYATPQGLPRSILVTSTQAGEGKSTTSLALADGFARLGRRVVLIDGDLRRPSLHKLVPAAPAPGLSDLLIGAATPEQAAAPTGDGFALIAAGPLPPNPTDLLSGGRLPELVRALEASFDLVVIDGPPVLGLADAPMLAANVQAVLFVVEANRGVHGRTRGAIRRLRLNGARILGALLTKFEARRAGVDRYYGYDYHQYDEAGEAR